LLEHTGGSSVESLTTVSITNLFVEVRQHFFGFLKVNTGARQKSGPVSMLSFREFFCLLGFGLVSEVSL